MFITNNLLASASKIAKASISFFILFITISGFNHFDSPFHYFPVVGCTYFTISFLNNQQVSLGVLPGYVWVAGNKSRPPKRNRMAVRNRFLFRKPQAAFHMVSILELIPSTIPLLMGYRA